MNDHAHSVGNPTLKTVTLILGVDPNQDLDQRIWQITRELGRVDYRAEILLVDPTERPLPRLTCRPIPPCFATLADAISAARFSTVGVIDAGIRFSGSDWKSLADLDADSIRTAVEMPRRRSPGKQFWYALLALITRLLLRIRRHAWASGITIFQPYQVRPVLSQLPGDNLRDDLTRLLAMTRQRDESIIERICYLPATAHAGPRSRELRRSIQQTIRFWFNELMFPAHSSQTAASPPNRKNRWLAISLLLLLATLMLLGSLQYPFFEPDETRNAQLALNIINNGQWSTLSLDGENYWDKPPLQIWSIAISYTLFGASAWSTRLPIALASLATVMLTLLVGKRLVGFRAALMGTLSLLASVGFLMVSRFTTMDAALTAAVTGTLLFGLLSLRGGFSRHLTVLASVCAGLGILIKGPVLLALCGPPLIAVHWLTRSYRPGSRHSRRWIWWLAPMTLIAGPWFLWVSWQHPEFLYEFLWKHNVVRFTRGFNHQWPFYFYLVGIFLFMFPVSYLFPSMLRFLASRSPRHAQYRSRELGWLVLSTAWIFLFFSTSTSKLPTYIAPTFPLIALMTGVWLEQRIFLHPETRRTWTAHLMARGPVIMSVWGVALAVAGWWLEVSWFWLAPVLGLLLLLGGLNWYARHEPKVARSRRIAWSTLTAGGMLIAIFSTQAVFPALATRRSDHRAVESILADSLATAATTPGISPPATPAVIYISRDPFASAVALPSGTQVRYFHEDELDDASKLLRRSQRAIVVAARSTLDQLEQDSDGQFAFQRYSQGRHVYQFRAAERRARQPNVRVLR